MYVNIRDPCLDVKILNNSPLDEIILTSVIGYGEAIYSFDRFTDSYYEESRLDVC